MIILNILNFFPYLWKESRNFFNTKIKILQMDWHGDYNIWKTLVAHASSFTCFTLIAINKMAPLNVNNTISRKVDLLSLPSICTYETMEWCFSNCLIFCKTHIHSYSSTSFSMWKTFSSPPDYSLLRVFGCTCYYHYGHII